MIALACLCLLVAAPARAARYDVVEARPAATPFLRLTGARPLAPAIGLWRMRSADARRLVRARLVHAAEPERPLRTDSEAKDPLLDDEWWLATVGATQVSAPARASRSRSSTPGSTSRTPSSKPGRTRHR
jgi:hypothetical protein